MSAKIMLELMTERDRLREALRKLLLASRNVDHYLDDCDGFQGDFQIAMDEARAMLP